MAKLLQSKRWTAYVLTLLILLVAWLFGAPPELVGALGRAVEYGLPTLLALESASDAVSRWRGPRPELDGPR